MKTFSTTSDPKADIGDSIIRIFIIPVDHGLTLKLYNGQAQPQFKLEQQKQNSLQVRGIAVTTAIAVVVRAQAFPSF
ncbi:hypothetical protein C4D60_Mb08t02260 [Musa balbisiana]|uniref:Uncharacterized protein n=1 Tax=Musa balbisiana TaxID=52838 RepID=A0A4S8K0U7_MUSBA|nr:hypothetical protein C4D60_Mb08t02260 [Musa balbisiana]